MIAAGVGRRRAHENRSQISPDFSVIGEGLLVRRHFKIRRQRVEPVLGTIDLRERLYPLAAAWQIILAIVGVLAASQTPLTQIVQALGRTGLRFGAPERWEQQACQDGNNRDHHEKFDQREAETRARGLHSRTEEMKTAKASTVK